MIGSYSELKHDLCMLAEENSVSYTSCSYADVLIEPNLTFWKEFEIFANSIKNHAILAIESSCKYLNNL